MEKLIELRKKLDAEVKANISEAQKRQNKCYDAKHQQASFKIGQVVLVKNRKKLSKKGDKMEPNWTGPYELAECVANNNYHLRRRTGSKQLNLNPCSTALDYSYSMKEVNNPNHVNYVKYTLMSILFFIQSSHQLQNSSSRQLLQNRNR